MNYFPKINFLFCSIDGHLNKQNHRRWAPKGSKMDKDHEIQNFRLQNEDLIDWNVNILSLECLCVVDFRDKKSNSQL